MPAAVGLLQGPGIIVNGSILSSPLDQAVLVDTGALIKGNYLVSVMGACSVPLVYDLQIRDATNTTNIISTRRRPAAGSEDFLLGYKVPIDSNQRIRLVLQGSIVGEVQLSILYGEVG